jgi:small subunit ribosomal protein S8
MVNYWLADLVVRLKVAARGHLRTIKVKNTKLTFKVLVMLYKLGIISGFKNVGEGIELLVYLKYYKNRCCFYDIKLVSKPGRRVYMSKGELSVRFNSRSLAGFYIISSPIGLVTSNDVLLGSAPSGEILFEVKV